MRTVLDVEQRKQLAGCFEESCLAEVGGALGARFLIEASIGALGDSYLVNMKLIDVDTARVSSRVSRYEAQFASEVAGCLGEAACPNHAAWARCFSDLTACCGGDGWEDVEARACEAYERCGIAEGRWNPEDCVAAGNANDSFACLSGPVIDAIATCILNLSCDDLREAMLGVRANPIDVCLTQS